MPLICSAAAVRVSPGYCTPPHALPLPYAESQYPPFADLLAIRGVVLFLGTVAQADGAPLTALPSPPLVPSDMDQLPQAVIFG